MKKRVLPLPGSMTATPAGSMGAAHGKTPAGPDTKPALTKKAPEAKSKDGMTLEQVKVQLARYAPVTLAAAPAALIQKHRELLTQLVKAAIKMDEIYLRQVYRRNPLALKQITSAIKEEPERAPLLDLFKINYGVWDRLSGGTPFWGTRPQPQGGGFYDGRMTRVTFSRYLNFVEATLSGLGKYPKAKKDRELKAELTATLASLRSPYTVVDRKDGEFVVTPYSEAYKYHLDFAAGLLKDASQHTRDFTLKRYLSLRAKAFATNDYEASERAALNQRGDIQAQLGPADTYDDRLMGYKAAFRAVITTPDAVYTKRLRGIWRYIYELQRGLPYKQAEPASIPSQLPVIPALELYSAGYTRAGFHTLSFASPFSYGFTKRAPFKRRVTVLTNIAQAKFEAVIQPASTRIINPEQLKYVTADAFVMRELLIETAAYLGPQTKKVGRDRIKIAHLLKEEGVVLEAAKREALAILAMAHLITKRRKGDEAQLKASFVTSVAALFRYFMFNTENLYSQAGLLFLNRLLSDKAVTFDMAAQTYTINFEKMLGATRTFAGEVLTLLEAADHASAVAYIKKGRQVPLSLKKCLEKLTLLPVDIRITHPLAGMLGIQNPLQ